MRTAPCEGEIAPLRGPSITVRGVESQGRAGSRSQTGVLDGSLRRRAPLLSPPRSARPEGLTKMTDASFLPLRDLDGRNPATYANVLCCFGLHDRAWQETPILGKVRPTTSKSTRRKFDLEPYFRQVKAWTSERDMPVLA